MLPTEGLDKIALFGGINFESVIKADCVWLLRGESHSVSRTQAVFTVSVRYECNKYKIRGYSFPC